MREFAKTFYKSKAWKDTREAYAKSVGGLCEICLSKGIYKPGEIVHHKIHIEPENISDINVVLSWDNLQLVCRQCHADLHRYGDVRRYHVDEMGRIIDE